MNKKSELVIYDNKVNQIAFPNFKPKELDLFMMICKNVKDAHTDIIELDVKDVMQTMNYKHRESTSAFMEYCQSLTEMFRKLEVTMVSDDEYMTRWLISGFAVSKKKKKLQIQVNYRFVDFFNDLNSEFTMIDYVTFLSLNSKYSKLLYKMLCQFRGSGKWITKLDDYEEADGYKFYGIRTLLDIPRTYDNKRIREIVLKPAIKELEPFMNIKLTVVRDTKKQGHPIVAYHFDFSEKKKRGRKPKTEKIEKVEVAEKIENKIDLKQFFNDISEDTLRICSSYNLSETEVQRLASIFVNAKADNRDGLLIDMFKNPDKYQENKSKTKTRKKQINQQVDDIDYAKIYDYIYNNN